MVQEKTASGAEDRWWHRRSMQRSSETGRGASCRGNMPWRVPGGRVEVCGQALINLSHPGSHACLRVTHFKLPEEEKKHNLRFLLTRTYLTMVYCTYSATMKAWYCTALYSTHCKVYQHLEFTLDDTLKNQDLKALFTLTCRIWINQGQ